MIDAAGLEGRKGSWVGLLGGGWNEWDEEGGPVFKGGGAGAGPKAVVGVVVGRDGPTWQTGLKN